LGQKTHPIGIRLGVIKTWDSRWYAKKGYSDQLLADITIRRSLKDKLFHAGVPKIEIERAGQNIRVIIHTARPGLVIGKKGSEIGKGGR
jgi:small subunit ribosomal protein S3